MLYTLLACCFVSHLNYTPAADSCIEPAAVISGPTHFCETAPRYAVELRDQAENGALEQEEYERLLKI